MMLPVIAFALFDVETEKRAPKHGGARRVQVIFDPIQLFRFS
jgi:hypothetical protein